LMSSMVSALLSPAPTAHARSARDPMSCERVSHFFADCGEDGGGALVLAAGGTYVAARRGTESQRARPPRCEAAPPKSRLSRKARPAKGSSSGAGPRRFCSCASPKARADLPRGGVSGRAPRWWHDAGYAEVEDRRRARRLRR
jgi:hypothetical protein